jgi:hypothetical protein
VPVIRVADQQGFRTPAGQIPERCPYTKEALVQAKIKFVYLKIALETGIKIQIEICICNKRIIAIKNKFALKRMRVPHFGQQRIEIGISPLGS